MCRILHRDEGDRSGQAHHDKDHTVEQRTAVNVTRLFVDNAVEDREDKHHRNEPEDHVYVQPHFRSVGCAVEAVIDGARLEVNEIVYDENEHEIIKLR